MKCSSPFAFSTRFYDTCAPSLSSWASLVLSILPPQVMKTMATQLHKLMWSIEELAVISACSSVRECCIESEAFMFAAMPPARLASLWGVKEGREVVGCDGMRWWAGQWITGAKQLRGVV